MRKSTKNTTTHMKKSTTPRMNTSPHHMYMTSTSMAPIMHSMDTSPHYTKYTTNINKH